MGTYQVISADGHNEVPVDRWSHWVPEKHRDKMPKLVKIEDGSEVWRIEAGGEAWVRSTSGNAVADWEYDQFRPNKSRYYREEDGSRRPGTGDAVQRLQEQDLDGIDAEVLYPPVYSPIFFKHDWKSKDKEAYMAFIRGYNDFIANEYTAVAPDRLITMALVPETGVDDAIAEMERCKKMGLRGVAMAQWPNGGISYMPEDDRFFAASLDLDIRLAPHGNFGGVKPPPKGAASITKDTLFASGGAGPSYTIGQLILNGVFDRFPKLRIYFAETQAGWLPHTLSWVDEFHRRWAWYTDAVPKKMPSEYYRDQCLFSFIVDRMAMQLRQYIGLDMLMWGSDFPHSVGSFPDTRRFLEDQFEGVPENEKRKVLVENPAEFFSLDMERELTPTP